MVNYEIPKNGMCSTTMPMLNVLDVVDQKENVCFPLGIRILVVAYWSHHTILQLVDNPVVIYRHLKNPLSSLIYQNWDTYKYHHNTIKDWAILLLSHIYTNVFAPTQRSMW